MRDYLTKVDNSAPLPQGILSADEDNVRFEEMKRAVSSAGITLDPIGGPSTDNQMLAQAMARYASGAIFCTDSGNANVYILSLTGSFVAPKAYFHGLRVGFMPGNTATGASTINCFTLGIKKLLRPDASVIVNQDVFANRYTEAWYDAAADGGAGAFRLVPWSIPVAAASGAIPLAGEGIAVDSSYYVSLNFPGLSSATPLSADVFAFYSQTGAHHRKISLADLIAILQAGLSSLSLASIAPAVVVEQRRQNLGAMTTITQDVWVKRPLSDFVVNQIAGASLNGSNQVTLPAGTYRAQFMGMASNAGHHRTRIYNVTAGVQLGVGNSADSHTGGGDSTYNSSSGVAHFTLTATSLIELQTFATNNNAGIVIKMSDTEDQNIGAGNYHVEGWVQFIKEA